MRIYSFFIEVLPPLTNFMFVSGDSDLRHKIKRLITQGKNVSLLESESHTGQFIKELVNKFVLLDEYPDILRKITQTEKEIQELSLLSNENVRKVIHHINNIENTTDKEFIGLNYVRTRLIDYYWDIATDISDALTHCIDNSLLIIYKVENPKDSKHPTRACKLDREHYIVNQILNT